MNDTLLRQLDPADSPKAKLCERARADLEWILSTDRRPAATPSRRTPRTRVAVGLTAATALAVAGVLAPSALRSGDTAFASWSPTADPLSATERAQAGESCRQELSEANPAAGQAHMALGDRRGGWTTVVLSGHGGFSGLCITDTSTGWFRKDMIGSAGVATGLDPVAARGVVATDLGTGTMAAGDISLAAGFAGPQVAGIALHTESHGVVTATIARGRFALWFPGDELENRDLVAVDVSYTDGSTAPVMLEL
jgi:hypothetical protein